MTIALTGTMYLEVAGHTDQVRVIRDYLNGDVLVELPSGTELTVQRHMLSGARHRAGDRPTAVDAARALTDDRLSAGQWKVLSALATKGVYGCIDDDYEAIIGLRADSAGGRRKELVRKGLVYGTGATRMTRRGARAEIYVITTSGMEVYERLRLAGNPTAGEVA